MVEACGRGCRVTIDRNTTEPAQFKLQFQPLTGAIGIDRCRSESLRDLAPLPYCAIVAGTVG